MIEWLLASGEYSVLASGEYSAADWLEEYWTGDRGNQTLDTTPECMMSGVREWCPEQEDDEEDQNERQHWCLITVASCPMTLKPKVTFGLTWNALDLLH